MARPRKNGAPEAAPETDLPKAVRLTSPYGYYTDANVFRAWDVGHVESDPDEVANLIARGAPIVEHQDGTEDDADSQSEGGC